MTKAQIAIRAAKNRKYWGSLPTLQYILNKKVSRGLYRLARQLDAVSTAEKLPSSLINQAS